MPFSTLHSQLRRGYFRSITYTMEIAPYCGVCNVKLSLRRGYFHSSNRKENTHSVDQLTHQLPLVSVLIYTMELGPFRRSGNVYLAKRRGYFHSIYIDTNTT